MDHLYIKVASAALGWGELLNSRGRLLGAGATNGLLMNAEEEEGEVGQMEAATHSSGQTLTQRKPVQGRCL